MFGIGCKIFTIAGPYLFRTGTGRLGMIWTSWIYNVYTQGVAYSESGTLDGPWYK